MSAKGAHLARVEERFSALADLTPCERHPLIEAIPGTRTRDEVRALLAAETAAEIFFSAPRAPSVAASDSLLGRRLGAYRVISEIGRGGMGVVYLGQRDDAAYQGEVAIKVFAASLARADLLERFRVERQILASLQHPNLARLVDGGSTEQGLPYLVMERIHGLPIDQHVEERDLSLHDRIRLFCEVGSAVSAAHDAGIVHRDLKPSNVLVDASGHPRLLDFGIATWLSSTVDPPEGERQGGLLTPEFASPEQLAGGEVGIASDIYSLGVLLSRLIGATNRPIVERWRVSRSEAKDLAAILARATAFDPASRYASVAALTEDLRLLLARRPITARSTPPTERIEKFARRHPWRSALGVLVLLLAAIAGAQSLTAAHAADAATHEGERRARVEAILRSMLVAADPTRTDGATSARAVLEANAPRILGGLAAEPELQADLSLAIGQTFDNAGAPRSAIAPLRAALALSERDTNRQRARLDAHSALAHALLNLGDYGEAERHAHEAVSLANQLAADDLVARELNQLGMIYIKSDRAHEAIPRFRRALAKRIRHDAANGGASDDAASMLSNLALANAFAGRQRAAEGYGRLALARSRPGSYLEAVALTALGTSLFRQGKLDEAEGVLTHAVELARTTLGAEHPGTAKIGMKLAEVEAALGRRERARARAKVELAALERSLGPDHPDTQAARSIRDRLFAQR